MQRLLTFLMLIVALPTGLSATTVSAQQLPIVGIAQMDDSAQTGAADTLSTMLETAIISTGKFRIIERSRLGRLEGEQANARTGRVTTNRPGRRGGFEGVDFLIYGSITGVSQQSRGDIGSTMLAGVFGNRNASCGRSQVSLTLDIRITDTNTGEVKLATNIVETAQSSTVCNAQGQVDTTVLMRAAANRIARQMVTTIYPIQVAAVQPDGILVLNYGSDTLNMGDRLLIFAPGEEIRDPTTGRVIDRMESASFGVYEIMQQTVRTSRARALGTVTTAPTVGSQARNATEDEIRAATGRRPSSRRGN